MKTRTPHPCLLHTFRFRIQGHYKLHSICTTLLLCLFFSQAQAQLFQLAGPAPATILPAVTDFRNALGVLNPNVPGSFSSGRREINWDGVPDAFAAPNFLPANFFNVNSPRGVIFSTPGTGFQVSANLASGVPVEFGHINPTYPNLFAPFSPQRLFTSIGSNVYDIAFFVPGSTTPAVTRGFGAVFTDVDLPNTTSIELFGLGNTPLGVFFAPPFPGNESFSFVGFAFPTPVITRVRITTGSASLSSGVLETMPPDLVVADDFIYGEPVAALSPADISVSKTASASTFVAGEQITYTITVTNNSAGPAQNVQLTDLLPAETALQSVTTSSTFTLSSNPAQNSFTASTSSFAGGATATFTATAKISPSQGSGSISNTASVSASNPDPNTGNNTATSTVTVTPLVTDLAITKTASPVSVLPGGTIAYTLTVQNTGTGTAENLTITDVLPAGTTLLSVVTPSGSSVSAPPLGQNGTVIWQAPMLANGTSVVYSATVQVDPQFTGTTITNTATVTGTTYDPDLSNNSATASTTTCPDINVSIPNAFALHEGVQPNTVYIGYAPASTILLTTTISGGTAPYQYSWSTGSHDASISVSPTVTTTYNVTVTDANGCPGGTASVTITVVDVRGGKNLNKVVICHKQKNTLSIDPTSVADHLSHGDQLGTCSLPVTTTVRRMEGVQDHHELSLHTTMVTYPNPFTGSTRIQYRVPVNADVSIRLFDVTGREVQAIFSGKQAAGTYNVDYNTSKLNAGVYFCQLVAMTNDKQFRQIYKMIKSK